MMDADHSSFHERQQQQQPRLRTVRDREDAMREKRKSEVMIAAQSLDSEVQSVKNLKRISIGSMDMLMDPELEYRVSSNAGKQEGRKSWTSGVPTRPPDEVESVHNRAAVRYTYPSRALEDGSSDPDTSFESDLSEISFDVTNSAYLEGEEADDNSSLLEGDTTGAHGSRKVSSSGRSISGVGSLKRGVNNVALRKLSTSSETSNGSNSSLTKNLLWVPANQHPNVKPENYLELVQDTLHNIKLDGGEGQEGGEKSSGEFGDDGGNKENEEQPYRPRKNSSLVRKPSRLRKSYTEFEDESETYQDVSGYSKKRSTEDFENTSNQTNSSANSSRAVSLRDITDELTKISNNAGLTDSDAITLARTLSMAGSFRSDEPDDIIENSHGEYGGELRYDGDAAAVEKRQDDSEFASNMFMKNGFVIPTRSSLRRSKFNTYRVRSGSDESLNEDSKSSDSASIECYTLARDDLSTQDDLPKSVTRTDVTADAPRLLEPTKEEHVTAEDTPAPAAEGETGVTHMSKQQEYLGTPADQRSHDSKSPSKFIGEESSDLTSPSTISDFQDIYDHYRQSSVDWEKELKDEEEFARCVDNHNKSTAAELPAGVQVTESLVEPSADASTENVVVLKDSSISSAEISTGTVLIRPEDRQPVDNTDTQQQRNHANVEQHRTAEQLPVKSAPAGQSLTVERSRSESNRVDASSGNSRQAQKRGGWAIFNMGAKDFLSDRREDKTNDLKEDETPQQEGPEHSQSGDFIKTSSHTRTEFERTVADRSNHSKNRHSPIFTESNKKEIFERSKSEVATEADIVLDGSDNQSDTDSSSSDFSNAFSAQRLEKKFVNLFKRKGKSKASSSKTTKTHKRLELTKKPSNNNLPKFRRTSRNQTIEIEEVGYAESETIALPAGTSSDPTLGEPVDDTLMGGVGSSYHGAREENREEHLSLQPAVSVQSTKSSPTIVVESVRELDEEESQDVSTDSEFNTSSEVSQDTVKMKKQPSQERAVNTKKSTQHPVRNKSQTLPPRKLTFSDVKRLDRPNAPMQFTDSAFGFPLPMLTLSTVVMFDHRLPINVERAIYRLSHLKLSDPKRELRQQVMLSNFMYAYLNLVNHTLYMEQVAQEGGHELATAAVNSPDMKRSGSGAYTTDQNDANGAICIPDI